jgi:hypothetical protein
MSNLKQMVSNENERVSSKRVIATICVILLCLAFIFECLGFVAPKDDSALTDALVYIAVVCLFGSTLEKFNFRKNSSPL